LSWDSRESLEEVSCSRSSTAWRETCLSWTDSDWNLTAWKTQQILLKNLLWKSQQKLMKN